MQRDSVHPLLHCLFTAALFFGPLAVGEPEPSYGMEIELRSPLNFVSPAAVLVPLNYVRSRFNGRLIRSGSWDPMARVMRERYIHVMRGVCARSKLCVVEGDRIIYPKHGFDFRITQDPSVVELVLSPMTFKQLQKNRNILQSHLFDVPSKLGLDPAVNLLSGGHVHIGIKEAFANDPLRFLNFVIDFANHPTLASGALLWDPFEAPPLLQTRKERAGFQQLLGDFDAGRIQTLSEIQDRLAELGFIKISMTPKKGALNTRTRYNTVEVRSNRSFRSADHLLLTIELFENRIQHLTTPKERLSYLNVGPPRSVEQAVSQFHQYVVGAGGNWRRFRKLLRPSWQAKTIRPEDAYRSDLERIPFKMKCALLFRDLAF